MKNQKGFAPVIVILVVVLLGIGTYAVVNRAVLKSYFEKGDKPTESKRAELGDKFKDGDIPNEQDSISGDKPTATQFSNLIDSSVNISDQKEESPGNLFPEDKKKFSTDEAMKAITFRWTPLVPKPKEPVAYRLRVWQLMQGQNGTQAMKESKPMVEKEVVGTTEASVSGIYTGPCKPPYLCDFVWQVQVAGSIDIASEPTMFSVVASEESNTGTGAR